MYVLSHQSCDDLLWLTTQTNKRNNFQSCFFSLQLKNLQVFHVSLLIPLGTYPGFYSLPFISLQTNYKFKWHTRSL